ncbi:MAG: hypothetical protein KC656_20065, partial [Myxococcales bacterium]|nr:hypothetical protein [Myxococcales bacterium]
PEACPTGLRIDRATRVERGFEGQARPMGTEPAEMEASMRDAASRGRVFGAYAQPWGWYAERFAPESFVLVVDVAGPPEEPWLPARIPARPWLRVPWEGGPYEVAPAILWLHERGAAEGGMRVGFAPTVTLFAPHGLDVWLPLRR